MKTIYNSYPQLDPCCYPLLRPRGTPGFRRFMRRLSVMIIC